MTSASLQQPYETRRALLLQENSEDDNITMEDYLTTTTASEIATSFQPTPLQILRKVFSTDNLSPIANIIIGELAALVAGRPESLIYVTVTGRIGALVPFASRAQKSNFTRSWSRHFELMPRPTGRDPELYRSYYAPVIHTVDGELCDAFNLLSHDDQAKIAERLI
jgi:CPSF A subunit region